MHLLTITPNPAIDVAMECAALDWEETLTAQSVRRAAGGKGLNMARVAAAMGHGATAVFLGGGPPGRFLAEELELAGIAAALVPIAGETRSNIVLRAPQQKPSGRTLKINMPGAPVRRDEANALVAAAQERLGAADAVALAGSMPPDMPEDAVETLCELIARRGVPFLADVQESWLTLACRAGRPALVKPNRQELEAAAGRTLATEREIVVAARELIELGAGAVAVTDGPRAAYLVTASGVWSARPPAINTRAVAGMGDAFGTGYLLATVEGAAPPDCFAQAMAYGAAVAAARETELLTADQVDLVRRSIHVAEFRAD